MRDRVLNADFWKKAYLLEFKKDNKLEDAFTFSVPPESEEFSFPQRRGETKTFGGAVIADYGNDLVNINLSGSTINQELKLIYKSSKGTEMMSGEDEIFYLQELLKKYGTRSNLQGKEVYLYSLNGGKAKNNHKWWRIYVGQLDISRSKDKPFCYNYKFSAIADPEVTPQKHEGNFIDIFGDGYTAKFKDNVGSTITGWHSKISEIVKKMYKVVNTIEEYGGGFVAELNGYLNTAYECVDMFDSACQKYADVINGITKGMGTFAVDTVRLGDKVLDSAFRYYPTLTADVWNTCLDTRKVFKEIYNICSSIDDKYFSASAWQSIKELFDDSVSNKDIADVYSTVEHDGIIEAENAVAITCKNLDNLGIAVIPGSRGEDDRLVITYGYQVVSITDAETNWDQIAFDYYGDSSLGCILATFNNLPSDNPLKSGQTILIPKLNFAENRVTSNEVYNTPDIKDNYGKDLLILGKDFAIYNGDLKLVDGASNLQQSLLNRYTTLVGARIRLEAYGIQASIGNAVNATSSLIQASVHQTTIEDPRIESVESISFEGIGDKLTVTVIYIDKNGTKGNSGGTI